MENNNSSNKIPKGSLVVAKDLYLNMNCYQTKRNNNVLVVGAAGTGKTRAVVTPNILQATGSYLISDPKGNLYKKYGKYLEAKGYEVGILSFTNPKQSMGYNFFEYIRDENDVLKVAHMLMSGATRIDPSCRRLDPFWEESAEVLLVAFIAYLMERPKEERTLDSIMKLIESIQLTETNDTIKSPADRIFDQYEKRDPNALAVRSYRKFSVAAVRTKQSIAVSLASRLGAYNVGDLKKLLAKDETDIKSMGHKKRTLFVQVSDTDRSMDGLANIFFTQAMQELCNEADNFCEDERLEVPVRFILDDFATNCTIYDFPRMISGIRSRGISTMLMIQAESQLRANFGADADTIIGNCDNYLYLGGNDLDTCRNVSYRADVPMQRILNMPVECGWFFRRGEDPVQIENFDIDENLKIWGKKIDKIFLPNGYKGTVTKEKMNQEIKENLPLDSDKKLELLIQELLEGAELV